MQLTLKERNAIAAVLSSLRADGEKHTEAPHTHTKENTAWSLVASKL